MLKRISFKSRNPTKYIHPNVQSFLKRNSFSLKEQNTAKAQNAAKALQNRQRAWKRMTPTIQRATLNK